MDISNNIICLLLALGVGFLFIVYQPSVGFELPDLCRYIFSNPWFVFICLLIMIYLGNDNILFVLVFMIILCLVLSMVNKYNLKDFLAQKINNDFYIEKFNNLDSDFDLDNFSEETGSNRDDMGLDDESILDNEQDDVSKNTDMNSSDSQSNSHSDSYSDKPKGHNHTHTHTHTHHG